MKNTQVNTRGFSFNVKTPETEEEYNKLAGEDNACVDDAVEKAIYSYWAKDFLKKFVEAVEAKTENTRKGSKGESGKFVYSEKEAAYLKRVEEDGLMTKDDLAKLAKDVAANIPFTCAKRTRAAAAPAATVQMATDLINAIESGKTTEQKVKNRITKQLGIDKYEDQFAGFCETSLVAALVAYDKSKEAEKVNEFL